MAEKHDYHRVFFQGHIKAYAEHSAEIADMPGKLEEIYTADKINSMVDHTFELADTNKDGRISWEEWEAFTRTDGLAQTFGKVHQLFLHTE